MLSNQKLIEEAVKQYLQCTDTDYAIMINGKWGVGKTYFVKNEIDNIIQNQNLKLMYVSLYGLSSCKDLNHHVFTAVYPFTGTTGFKIGKAVTETILKKEDISFAAHDLDFPIKNAVLVFDDLERVTDKVTVHHMLGCINRYVEQKRIKTIIICDESQLNNNADYINTKEKIVRFTYSFNPDSKYLLSLADDMASKHGKEVCSAVSRNAAFIRSLSETDYCNIRIMNSTILMTSFLIKELKKHDILNYDDYVDYMFKCFMGYSVEINKNKQSYLDRLIDGNITPLSILFRKKNSSDSGSLDDDDGPGSTIDNDYSFADMFYEKYFTRDLNPYLSNIALVICKNGICDADDLLSEYEEFTRKRSPQDTLELLAGDFWKLEDSEFLSIVEDVLNRLRQGGVETTGKLARVVDVLSFLVENNVISSIDENELLVLGKSCVDKISDKNEKSFVGCMQSFNRGVLISAPNSEVAKNILSYAEDKANSLSESLHHVEAEHLWSKIADETGNEGLYALFADNSEWMLLPFFSFMDSAFFVNKTMNMRNETIISIAGAIKRRYTLFQEAKEKLYADITPFESLIAEVDKRIKDLPETATKPLKLLALEKLCENLRVVINILKSAPRNQQIN
ncbi:P-loop NTPase fold protein [Acidithiobacillus thiooxidans]|uniref:KAP NTPase domain-containing protein n=1 Tax=Acidithiobacillus thiooxidans TaxID=930 RepID=A0A1C2II47_ACITH|nr:P-loop NTPase fold protein [Acidithiobacillus thiooxidans]OCX75656.1 hypothetical protein A6M23_01675 [Acidithiobacillus thiooxidans]OCX87207.1 hypothetical protein A6P08_03545 [Acidithiobacillus thiooxidans]